MDTAVVVGVIGAATALVTGLGGILVGHWLGRGSAKEDRVRAARLEEIEHTLRYGNAQLDQVEAALMDSRKAVERLAAELEQHPWANFGLLGDSLADEFVDALVLGRRVAVTQVGEQRAAMKQLAILKLKIHERLQEQRMRVLRGEDLLGGATGFTPEELERRVDKLASVMDEKPPPPRIY